MLLPERFEVSASHLTTIIAEEGLPTKFEEKKTTFKAKMTKPLWSWGWAIMLPNHIPACSSEFTPSLMVQYDNLF